MRRYEIANKEVVDNLERDKVDKIPGKVLSEHDFNSFYKQKIDGFESYVDGKVKTDVPANAKFTDTDTTYSEITTAEIDAGTASTLRTITARRIKYILDKVQGWISSLTKSDIGLGDVDNTSDLAKPISTATQTELNLKADKTQVLTNVPVDAKFTDTVYTHPSTHSASMVTEEVDKRFLTDAERVKLNAIETGANNYVHPENHPADMIVETASKRFTSDTEKSSWDAKQGALGFTPENPINKGKSGGYAELDANAKIPLSQLPDIAKQQTYVVTNIGERDLLTGLIMGERCYLTSTGDSYIWNGISWLTLSKADWENINLQWSNITGKPASTVTNLDDAVNKRHVHANKDIIDSISQTNIDSWNGKAEVSQIPTKLSDFVDDVKPYYKDNLPPVKTDKLWLDTSK